MSIVGKLVCVASLLMGPRSWEEVAVGAEEALARPPGGVGDEVGVERGGRAWKRRARR